MDHRDSLRRTSTTAAVNCGLVAATVAQLASAGAHLAPGDLEGARACIVRGRGSARRMALTRDYLALIDPDLAPQEAAQLLDEVSDPAVRDEVFWSLIDHGPAALPLLAALTRRRDDSVRWHAYDAIRRVNGSEAIPLLVRGLTDRSFAIRWVAGRGLVDAGPKALVPVLRALVREPGSAPFHQAARYVLRRLDAGDASASMDALIASLGRSTTVYESEMRALDVLVELADANTPIASSDGA